MTKGVLYAMAHILGPKAGAQDGRVSGFHREDNDMVKAWVGLLGCPLPKWLSVQEGDLGSSGSRMGRGQGNMQMRRREHKQLEWESVTGPHRAWAARPLGIWAAED